MEYSFFWSSDELSSLKGHLILAIHQGVDGLERLRHMLEDEMHPNQLVKDRNHNLLAWAFIKDNFAAMRLLCKHGADVNSTRISVSLKRYHSFLFCLGISVLGFNLSSYSITSSPALTNWLVIIFR